MKLEDFLRGKEAALAFSGGADSAFLLAAAVRAGCRAQPYFVQSAFQPAFELADAKRLCEELGVELRVLEARPLEDERVRENGPQRCYYCKRMLFSTLVRAARADGFFRVWDGTNASDDVSDRPGMRALEELGVESPLRLCGLTKADVRRMSRQWGLFTAQKPAYACLATRVPTGTALEAGTLRRVEAAEGALMGLGFSDLRLRVLGRLGRLQLPAGQLEEAARRRDEITGALAPWFDGVLLDLVPRKEE